MRRCKAKECDNTISPAAKCDNIIEKKGYCSIKCVADHEAQKRIEAEKRRKAREHKKAKERIKTSSDWLKEAQAEFNKWVKLRDANEPCISCQRHHQGQYHAGHYKSVGACPELRFEPLNVHKQCAPCNNQLSGNIIEYRINLVGKIGAAKVAWLERHHPPKHYTIDEIKQIKAEYKALAAKLKTA